MGMNELKLIDTVTKTSPDTVTLRRRKLLKAIDRQISLLSLERPTIGARNRWIFEQTDGSYQLAVKYGSKPLELAKGKKAISCSSTEQLVAALNVVRQSVVDCKLDAQIEAAANAIRAGFKKAK